MKLGRGSIWFRFKKDLAPSPRTVINPVQPVMAVEEKPDGGMAWDQYPGSNLSISELCHALKIKLSQTRDPRYGHATAQRAIAFQLIQLATPELSFPSH